MYCVGDGSTLKVPADPLVTHFLKSQGARVSRRTRRQILFHIHLNRAVLFRKSFFFFRRWCVLVTFSNVTKEKSSFCSGISAREIKPAVGSRASPALIKNLFALPLSLGGPDGIILCPLVRKSLFFFFPTVRDGSVYPGRPRRTFSIITFPTAGAP